MTIDSSDLCNLNNSCKKKKCVICSSSNNNNVNNLSLFYFCEKLKYQEVHSTYLNNYKISQIYKKLHNKNCSKNDYMGEFKKNKLESKVRKKNNIFKSYNDYLNYQKSLDFCPPFI